MNLLVDLLSELASGRENEDEGSTTAARRRQAQLVNLLHNGKSEGERLSLSGGSATNQVLSVVHSVKGARLNSEHEARQLPEGGTAR